MQNQLKKVKKGESPFQKCGHEDAKPNENLKIRCNSLLNNLNF